VPPLDAPAPIPQWQNSKGDPRAAIRVMDLLHMSSGILFTGGGSTPAQLAKAFIPGTEDHLLGYQAPIDIFAFSASRPQEYPPNTVGRYRNSDPWLVGSIVRRTVEAMGEEYLTWPQRELFDRIGIRRQVLETDPYGNFLLSGYDYGTPRNWARLGMLYLQDGMWQGERILPEGFVKFVSTPAPAWKDSTYGGMVWVNARGGSSAPRDAFAFRGAGGQETWIIPSRKLVVVRMGHFPGSAVGTRDLQRALALLSEAVPAVAPR
jgi:CubicO group peptidase (beta-lactamase class C family)